MLKIKLLTLSFQILELYQLLKDTEGISRILPQTVERLKALEGLHAKG